MASGLSVPWQSKTIPLCQSSIWCFGSIRDFVFPTWASSGICVSMAFLNKTEIHADLVSGSWFHQNTRIPYTKPIKDAPFWPMACPGPAELHSCLGTAQGFHLTVVQKTTMTFLQNSASLDALYTSAQLLRLQPNNSLVKLGQTL